MSPRDFVENSELIKGPDFLRKRKVSRLKENYEDPVDPDSSEVKKVTINTKTEKESFDILNRLIKFSRKQKAKVAVALWLR